MSDCRFGVSPVNYPDPDPEVILGQAAIKIQSPVNLFVFVFGKATWRLGLSIKCGVESWSEAWRLGVSE